MCFLGKGLVDLQQFEDIEDVLVGGLNPSGKY